MRYKTNKIKERQNKTKTKTSIINYLSYHDYQVNFDPALLNSMEHASNSIATN